MFGSVCFAQVSLAASSVTLAWDASTDSSVVSYNVYYGTASGSYSASISAGSATTATVSNLLDGTTYYFAATAVNSSGVESPDSNEISYTTPGSGVNQPPTLDAIGNLAINEDAAQQNVALTGITSGATNEVQTLTVSASSSNPNLIPNPAVSYTSPNTSGGLTFTPVANAYGTAIITVTVNDGQAANNLTTRTFTVTVNPVNDQPTLNAIANITINEDASQQTVSLSGIASGATNEVQTLTVSASSSNPNLIPNPSVAYTSPNTTGSLSFTPIANAYGSATITVTVNDGQAANNLITRTFTVSVNPVNDLPTLNGLANLTINENAAQQTVNLSGISSGATNESQTLTITATSSNPGLIPNPTVTYASPNATGSISFTPVTYGFGSATITVSAKDNQPTNNTISRTFTVTVNAVNQAPTLDPLADLTIAQDAGSQPVSLSGITSGASNEIQTLTVTAASSNPSLIPNPSVTYSSPGNSGSLSFTPAAGASGSATITVTVNDGQAQNNTISRTFNVTVTAAAVNQPPTVDVIANISINENSGPRTINLTGVTSGGENQTLTVTANSSSPYLIPTPTVNYVSPNTTGSLVITPVANSYGSATLSVTVNDGGSQNNTITRYFSVIVNQVQNTPPTISGLTNYTTVQDTATAPIPFTVYDAETPSANLTLFAYSDDVTLVPDANIVFGGSDSNRSVTITPSAGQSGTANITIQVSDGITSTYGYFSLTVTPGGSKPPPNTPPSISVIPDQTIGQDSTIGPIPFVIGDAESLAGSLTVSALSDNQVLVPDANILLSGTDANRAISLTPAAASSGVAHITVVVSDGMASNSATFALTVQATGPSVAINVAGQGSVTPNLTGQTLTPGNTYSLTAVPAPGQIFCGWSGNMTSAVAKISFVLTSNLNLTATFDPLTIITNGLGTLSTNLAESQSLVEGRTYSVTALPKPGQVFAGWTGSYTSSAPKLTFVLSDDTVLIANFIPSPFLAVQGSYSGLFYDNDGVQQYSAGFITLAVTASGGYSGWLKLGASKVSFSGSLDILRRATRIVALNSHTNLTLRFAVQDAGTFRLIGTVSDGTWSSQVYGDKGVFNATTNPCPYAASYTVLFPRQDDDPTLPMGYGYGSVRVTSGGSLAFAGTLADGTKISQSVPVSQQGAWPLFASPYSGKGIFISWMNFENRVGDDIHGFVDWIKLPNSRATYYPGGFSVGSKGLGSIYVAPTNSTTHVLALDQTTLAFSGGDLTSDFTNSVALGLSSVVTGLGPTSLSMTFTLSTGVFSGNATDPSTGNSLPFSGAVFQKLNDGAGLLLGGNQSSRVLLGQ